jgi:drug/metabolite transporter (DMT)-like permease
MTYAMQELFFHGQREKYTFDCMNPVGRRRLSELLLVLATLIWGASFVVVKAALVDAAPLPWLVGRFGISSLLAFLLLARKGINTAALLPALLLGLLLFCGFGFQTFGQKYTTPQSARLSRDSA